jgi:hypothetical protein
MKKFLKIIFSIILSLSLFIAGYIFWFSFLQFYSSSLSREFYSTIEKQKNQNILDLRQLQSVDWDELSLWPPYGNICDLGIHQYEKGSENCQFSMDDGEAYLLFLKNNKLVEKVPLNRKRLDLVNSPIPWRIPKEKAIFVFIEKGNWPRIKILKKP